MSCYYIVRKGYPSMKQLLSGNEAIARGLYEAGTMVCSAYPGTPSTEIFETLPQYKDSLYCEWAPNEKVATEVAYGAAIAGARSVCAMKHVGLNVASDPLFTAAYNGVNAGFIVISADDPSMHSSQNEQDNRWYAMHAKVACVEPSDSQECKDFIKEAISQLVMGDIILFEMVAKAAQADNVFTHRAVAHFGLFKQVLFKADDIEEIALLFAMQIAAETT